MKIKYWKSIVLTSIVFLASCFDYCFTAHRTHAYRGVLLRVVNSDNNYRTAATWDQTSIMVKILDSLIVVTDPSNLDPQDEECETTHSILHPIDSFSFTTDRVYNQNVGKDLSSIIERGSRNLKEVLSNFNILWYESEFNMSLTEPPDHTDTFSLSVVLFDTTGRRFHQKAQPFIIKP